MRQRLLLWLVLLVSVGLAKPMAEPTLPEGVQRSTSIVLASYLDCHATGPVDYLNGPQARYRVIRSLRGGLKPGQTLRLRYEFQDGSACLPLQGFHWSPADMPAQGTQFVLLLVSGGPLYRTYRGDFGRLPASQLEAVSRLLPGR